MISRTLLRQLTPDVIQRALAERARLTRLEAISARRQKLMAALAVIEKEMAKLDGSPATTAKAGRHGRRKGFKISAATREKMRQAALRRYGKAAAPKVEPRKRKSLSPESRAKMAEAARRRWAKVKGEAVSS